MAGWEEGSASESRACHLTASSPRTLPETKMETPKGPYKDYTVPLKGDYMGFHVSFQECNSQKHWGQLGLHEFIKPK